MYSAIIRKAKIHDGTGNPWYVGDIAFQGDNIAAMGDLGKTTSELEIDAAGLAAAPGFIDGLHDRGVLRPGLKADLVLFDPASVADRATYADPWQYPVGIEHVFVNGRHTISGGRHLGTRSGSVLRRR